MLFSVLTHEQTSDPSCSGMTLTTRRTWKSGEFLFTPPSGFQVSTMTLLWLNLVRINKFILLLEPLKMLYGHFNDHLIISCNRYFDGTNQPVPFWNFHLLLSLSQNNLSKPFGNMAIIASIFFI